MRWSRLVVVSALVAVVALSVAGLRTLSSPRVARAKAAPVPAQPFPRGALERQLQLLAQRLFVPSHGVPILPVPRAIPYGAPCYVALGRCSLTPCVEFAQGLSPGVAATDSAVVLKLGGPVSRAAPQVPAIAPQVARPACRGRLGTPKVLRVSSP
jgi:hypothetical protein